VDLLRPAIALGMLWMLARVARVAWRERALTLTLWRAIRARHVLGAVGLLVVVAGLASAAVLWIPGADLGLGQLVGLHGNAVFAPLEEGLARAGPPPAHGPDWLLLAGVSLFLGPLLLLLPWLAFVEEEVFRSGLEAAPPARVVLSSAVFGLAHLVMLVPVGAALAIGVAGAAYAMVYRRAYAAAGRPDAPAIPRVVLRTYRPSRRARAAAARARRDEAGPVPGAGTPGSLPAAPTSRSAATGLVLDPRARQAVGVHAAAVWHTTFNSLLVTLVWLGFAYAALSPMAG
jgi:hypothetical protein